MNENKTVLGLVGSPNSQGRTNQLVSAALEGAARAGATIELVQMSEHVVDACRDCLPWVCRENLKCSYEDKSFELLSQKILNCDGLVFGTPVYWWDTSAMVNSLLIKMCRVFARAEKLQGLPAVGIAIAGGTGNGLTFGLWPLYRFFRVMQMRALEPLPATRFDFNKAINRAEKLGHQIAGMIQKRHPFSSFEESLLWYDSLPYLGKTRTAERRLLAAIASEAVPDERKQDTDGDLARAEILAASGHSLDSMKEVSRVYNSCIEIIDEK
ncbi:flavodoxin family protein [Chloroflexota bacterium]